MSENQNVPSWDVSMSIYQQEISYELPKDSGYCHTYKHWNSALSARFAR